MLAVSLMQKDANEDVMVVIDELDKIASEEAFEGLLAEFLNQANDDTSS